MTKSTPPPPEPTRSPSPTLSDSDDEPLTLSSSTLLALQSFLTEKQETEEKFERLRAAAHDEADQAAEDAESERLKDELAALSMDDFNEDWQLSQFWYDEETAEKLAQEAIRQTKEGDAIVCVSAPTAFVSLKKLNPPKRRIVLLEYDRRFAVFSRDYVFYDYNNPLDLDERSGSRPLHNQFDFIIADPPFLSDECWTKTAQTVRWLAKTSPSTSSIKLESKLLVCTGQVMKSKLEAELDAKETHFDPRHKGGLANEFRCYATYDSNFGFR
ncbi:EEF1A lysine methyltransferase 1 [Rhizophlyctis rosea]|uniref:Protein-lysine N-methyltransferase EFM5 n=1 Tax=Rhizophlyctis rosea TaxID=64517 RepID=A0AAD5SLE7_9FUNG|nr:EEF1A lysine methyltransferase 1 [Rhizophlyctis rosea]